MTMRSNGQHIQCMGNVGTVYIPTAFELRPVELPLTCDCRHIFLLSPVSAQSNVCPGVLYNIVHDYTHTTYKFWLKLLHEEHVVPRGSLRLSRKNSYMYLKGTLSSPHPHPTQGEFLEIPRGKGELTLQPRFYSNCRKSRASDAYIKALDLKTFPSHMNNFVSTKSVSSIFNSPIMYIL